MSAIRLDPWLGLRAALLLARGRADGAVLMVAERPDEQIVRARHSFLAMALCVPIYLAIHLFDGPDIGPITPRGLASLVLGWLGYAVLSHVQASSIGRAALWPRFLVLWNWCNLVQYLLLAVAMVPDLLGAPPVLVQTVWLAAMGWALWLQWSATRLALALPGAPAAVLVIADVLLGVAVMRLTAA